MTIIVDDLEQVFIANADPSVAAQQKAYMRNKFEYFGLKSEARRKLYATFLIKKNLLEKSIVHSIIKQLWSKQQRDYQYFGMDLMKKYVKKLEVNDISLFEFMIVNKSWWDTVDFIASTLIGEYFLLYPNEKNVLIEKWLNSGNIWLQRTTLIFQLKYKDNVDTNLLSYCIKSLRYSEKFFLNKAIGWALRQYGKYNPNWVIDFVNNTNLSNMSKREALKLIV